MDLFELIEKLRELYRWDVRRDLYIVGIVASGKFTNRTEIIEEAEALMTAADGREGS